MRDFTIDCIVWWGHEVRLHLAGSKRRRAHWGCEHLVLGCQIWERPGPRSNAIGPTRDLMTMDLVQDPIRIGPHQDPNNLCCKYSSVFLI